MIFKTPAFPGGGFYLCGPEKRITDYLSGRIAAFAAMTGVVRGLHVAFDQIGGSFVSGAFAPRVATACR